MSSDLVILSALAGGVAAQQVLRVGGVIPVDGITGQWLAFYGVLGLAVSGAVAATRRRSSWWGPVGSLINGPVWSMVFALSARAFGLPEGTTLIVAIAAGAGGEILVGRFVAAIAKADGDTLLQWALRVVSAMLGRPLNGKEKS